MSAAAPHVSVCIATYQRPQMLLDLLTRLTQLNTEQAFSFSVVVADNDSKESARDVVARLSVNYPVPLKYCVEPRRSISHVRNKTIAESRGDAIAFIDDDEFPEPNWLLHLVNAWKKHQAAGVLGPVRPYFPPEAPKWVEKSGLFDRPEHETGYSLKWHETRTGNVVFDRRIIEGLDPVFLPEFGTGGSDQDFFRRMMASGHIFIWCSEGIVHEVVQPSRWKRRVLMRRALLRGQNSWRHRGGRAHGFLKSLAAAPLYTLALPFLLAAGHHLFVRYSVKLCDHLGRLLASMGINPVATRDM